MDNLSKKSPVLKNLLNTAKQIPQYGEKNISLSESGNQMYNQSTAPKRKCIEERNVTPRKDTLVEKLKNYVTETVTERVNRIDILWEKFDKQSVKFEQIINNIERYFCSKKGNLTQNSNIEHVLEKTRRLAELWHYGQSCIYGQFQEYKSDFKEIRDKILVAVAHNRNSNEIFQILYEKKFNKIQPIAIDIQELQDYRIFDIKEQYHARNAIIDDLINYLIKVNEESNNLKIQDSENSIAVVQLSGVNSPEQNILSEVINEESLSPIALSEAQKRIRIDESASSDKVYLNQEKIKQIQHLVFTYLNSIGNVICDNIDIYFEEMRLYNLISEQHLNACIKIIWPGQNYSSFIQQMEK